MDAITNFLDARPSKQIFHYTDAAGAIGILQQHCLWASSSRHMNDSSEFVHARDWLIRELGRRDRPLVRNIRNAFLKLEGRPPSEMIPDPYKHGRTAFNLTESLPVFVASFSEEEDLLSQWRAYGSAYSLGFDLTDYRQSPLTGLSLVKCVYTEEQRDQLCTWLIESWKEREADANPDVRALLEDCLQIIGAVKDRSFAEEKEWRLIGNAATFKHRFRPGRHGIVPYVEIPIQPMVSPVLKTVWIGPSTQGNVAVEAFRQLAYTNGFNGLEYKMSSIPYRG